MDISSSSFERVTNTAGEREKIVRPSIGYWKDAFRRFKKNKVAVFFTFYLIFLVIGSIIFPILAPYSYYRQDLSSKFLPLFSGDHIFGTDHLGRDVFARIWTGAQISLMIAILAVIIDTSLGILIGGIAGYFGGRVEIFIMRAVDILSSIPYLLVVILLMLVLPRGIISIVVAYAIVGWTGMARQVRGMFLQVKNMEYVQAAKALGADTKRIIIKYLIPNSISVIIVYMTFSVPSVIFTESFLSYIGIGVPPPIASWGVLASDGTQYLKLYPHLFILPAIFISMTMLSCYIVGDALRDALDPKLRK